MKKILSIMLSLMMLLATTVVIAKDEVKAGEYSVPYTILNAYNKSVSMADESRDGNMIVKINEDGTTDYYMSIKARVQEMM